MMGEQREAERSRVGMIETPEGVLLCAERKATRERKYRKRQRERERERGVISLVRLRPSCLTRLIAVLFYFPELGIKDI